MHFSLILLAATALGAATPAPTLNKEQFRHYIDDFNAYPTPDVVSYIPDEKSWDWLKANVPFFTCPDPDVERTWYYRWWAYRKHIRQTPQGFILTEFLRPVKHATDHNAISCALGHHIAEGRWLKDPRYIDDYIAFWLHSGPNGGLQKAYHQYSNWTAWALLERFQADNRKDQLVKDLDALVLDYTTWQKDRQLPDGMFWQYDVRDGMEESISGGRRVKNRRPTINSYMYANAVAIARIAQLAGKPQLATEYESQAAKLKVQIETTLWNNDQQFFETVLENGASANVRELIGYTPWLFNLPSPGKEAAWKQLMDPQGFFAPYGPTTAERRHPGFVIAESGDDCQWNGPSWPFSTSLTLKALANVLNNYKQTAINSDDYLKTFLIYTRSQKLDDRAFIDENLNPLTGEWHARGRTIRKGTFRARGEHYNHSSYADLVITGLVGLRPQEGNTIVVNPLANWDWFALDSLPYHGHTLTIVWDRTGKHFGTRPGLTVYANSRPIAHSATLKKITAKLP